MKGPLFQLVGCGVALGLMCGAVAIHSLHVSGAKSLADSGDWTPGDESSLGFGAIIPTSLAEVARQAEGEDASRQEATTVRALQEIVSRLQELKSENQNLHGVNLDLQDQLEETNRDLNELQIRVDSHSESFRPMRASSSGSILQGSISPGNSLNSIHPLLPPKE